MATTAVREKLYTPTIKINARKRLTGKQQRRYD
jgi:hypothetical protein